MLDALFDRRSIRRYRPDPVEPEKLQKILDAAMYAPSAQNRRPWHFIVCDDRPTIDRIRASHPFSAMLAEAPVCIVVCGDTTLECAPDYFIVDCSIATQNILLAAHELGLGACWLGVCPREERMSAVNEVFNLPKHIKPHSLVALGCPAEQKPRPDDRLEPCKIHHNKW